MRRALLAITAIAGLSAPLQAAVASDRSDIVAEVQAFNAAGSTGDRAAYVSHCTDDAEVIDHETPYAFPAPDACGKDWDALTPWAAKNGITFDNFRQTLGPPAFINIDGDAAYAVFPAKAWFMQDGKRSLERLYATFVLRRQGGAWRIARVTWTSLGWGPAATPRR